MKTHPGQHLESSQFVNHINNKLVSFKKQADVLLKEKSSGQSYYKRLSLVNKINYQRDQYW